MTGAYCSFRVQGYSLPTHRAVDLVEAKTSEAERRSIGIGGSLAAPPLPHHRTYGSVYGGSAD